MMVVGLIHLCLVLALVCVIAGNRISCGIFVFGALLMSVVKEFSWVWR